MGFTGKHSCARRQKHSALCDEKPPEVWRLEHRPKRPLQTAPRHRIRPRPPALARDGAVQHGDMVCFARIPERAWRRGEAVRDYGERESKGHGPKW